MHKHTRQHSINIQQNIHKIRTPYCYHTQQVRYHMHVHVDYHQLLDGYMQPYTQHGLSDRYAFTISSRSTYSHLSCNGHLSASIDPNRQNLWRKKKKAVRYAETSTNEQQMAHPLRAAERKGLDTYGKRRVAAASIAVQGLLAAERAPSWCYQLQPTWGCRSGGIRRGNSQRIQHRVEYVLRSLPANCQSTPSFISARKATRPGA